MKNPFNLEDHLASSKSAYEAKTAETNTIREEANKAHFQKSVEDAIKINSLQFLEFGIIKEQLDNILRSLSYDVSVENYINNTYKPTVQYLKEIENYKTQFTLAKLNNNFEGFTIRRIENAFSILTVNNISTILEELRECFLKDSQHKTQKEIEKEDEKIRLLEIEEIRRNIYLETENITRKKLEGYLNDFRSNFSSIQDNPEFLNTFNSSCRDAWRAAFNISNSASITTLRTVVTKEKLELKNIINIPNEYYQTSLEPFKIGNSDNLPLNMLTNLKELTLINFNICFLPILTLPNLKILRLVNCYSNKILKGGTYVGIPINEESYMRLIEPFRSRYPNVEIYGK